MHAGWFYGGMFLTSAVYCYILQRTKKRWEPDFVWVMATIGVALTGCWVRLYHSWGAIPVMPSRDAFSWQQDWHWVYFFLAGAVPVAAWQIYEMRKRLLDAFLELRESVRGGE